MCDILTIELLIDFFVPRVQRQRHYCAACVACLTSAQATWTPALVRRMHCGPNTSPRFRSDDISTRPKQISSSSLSYVMLWNELVLGAVMSQSNCKDT